ncbi:MAG: CHC2 zinc finger domain-containing protein, partial [Helicobacter sp.]|nr:CHC2 zinc finger domain-containing protein [Helicobacter sp.]
MITKDSIEQLKDRIDIVEIISSYIDLRKAGTNFSACCPFHNEKTPSFIVSPARNSYHCYGCGVGGDCISFVM